MSRSLPRPFNEGRREEGLPALWKPLSPGRGTAERRRNQLLVGRRVPGTSPLHYLCSFPWLTCTVWLCCILLGRPSPEEHLDTVALLVLWICCVPWLHQLDRISSIRLQGYR
ncbi:uncharacterized protein LOC143695328 [Agelaius phoeniceus]|uniref:uncharacterized protein LOC143695328 n=1 Tax=Agelaius phoeniceus TaxID=39638 RepID=UPI0040552B73